MSSQGWWVPLLGVASILAVVAILLLVRVWPRRAGLSEDDLADLADAPMTALQRRAWWGLGIGVAALGASTILLLRNGATAYWEDDAFRLTVLAIFLAGLLGSALVTVFPLAGAEARGRLDERDRAVLARAPTAQVALILLGLAGWLVSLGQMFHDEGAVPMVYLYLMFGSLVLLLMIGQSIGILVGYWAGAGDAEG
jgi:hypothetical protein